MTPDEREFWRERAALLVGFDDLNQQSGQYDLRVVPSPQAAVSSDVCEQVLCGVATIPLAKEFRMHRPSPVAEHCVIGFGMRDSPGGSVLALKALTSLRAQRPNLLVTCLIGASAPNLEEMSQLVAGFGEKGKLILDCTNVPAVLQRAELAIGGGGISLFERMCMGLPNIVVTIADNQRELAQWIGREGGASVLGDVATVTVPQLATEIDRLLDAHDSREQMSRTAQTLVDGRGAQRIADEILAILAEAPRPGPKRAP